MEKSFSREPSILRQNPMLLLLGSFIAGILIQQQLLGIPLSLWIIAVITGFLTTLILHQVRTIYHYTSQFRTATILISIVVTGSLFSYIQSVKNNTSWYGHYLNKTEAIQVLITAPSVTKAKTVLLSADVTAINISGKWQKASGPLALYIYRKNLTTGYYPGQTLIIPARIQPIKNSGNPYGFDIAGIFARKGIFHQAYLSADQIFLFKKEQRTVPLTHKLKQFLQVSIDRNVRDSTTHALISAILLNERNALNDDLMTAYSNTGIIHIIAISGMHIVLLTSFLLLLLKIIPSRKWIGVKYGISVIIVWIYIALTGFPPSAVRAALMFTLLSLGIVLNKTNNPVNIWATSGLCILCYNPYWLYDVGVQLSFLAVLSILLFYTSIKKWLNPEHKILQWLWEVVAVSIAAQILLFPLVIYYFNQFPLLGLIANVPAALYSTFLMFGGILIFIINACGFTCIWLGNLLIFFTRIFNNIILFLSGCTPQLMRNMRIDAFQYWLMMGIIILFCVFCFRKKNNYLLSGLSLCILLITDVMFKDLMALHQEKLVVYNTNKKSLADLFKGKKVTHLFAADAQQEKHILLPAKLGLGITHEATDYTTMPKLISLKHATVLFLSRCNIKPSGRFPVNILVVSDESIFDPQLWFETFHPQKIILDGSLPKWKALKWKSALEEIGARVHWVQEDGPWIYPSL